MQLADFKKAEKLATRIGARFLNKYEPCVTHVIAKLDDNYRAAVFHWSISLKLGAVNLDFWIGLDRRMLRTTENGR